MSLRSLFEFIEWVDYCYGLNYEERYFREEEIPRERVIVDTRKIKEQESLLGEKDAEIEKLRKKIASMSEPVSYTHLSQGSLCAGANLRIKIQEIFLISYLKGCFLQ